MLRRSLGNSEGVVRHAADQGSFPWSAAFFVSGGRDPIFRSTPPWYDTSMKKADEQRIAARLAKVMAMMCVRNSKLENIHAGVFPVTKAGDYSDVMVLDADGRRIPWNDVSHIDDAQMRDLMKDIVDRLFTFQMRIEDAQFQAWIDRWVAVAEKWDDPELDQKLTDP